MNDGAREENRRREVAGQEWELKEINRKLARLIVLIEALLRAQGWTVTPTTIMSPIRIAGEDDENT